MLKSGAKVYAKDIIITFLNINSWCTFTFFTIAGFSLLLNALYRNKARFFKARSFWVAKSNANRNSHGLLKYFVSINSYLKSSNAGQQNKMDFIFHSRKTQWTIQIIHIIKFKSWSIYFNIWYPKSKSCQCIPYISV